MRQNQIVISILIAVLVTATTVHAADYPQWRNDGSGSAADSGVTLVDDIHQVKLAWKSEAQLPPCGEAMADSGLGGPSLADGAVYVAYYQPSGGFIDKAVHEIVQSKGNRQRDPSAFRVFADDVLVCMDAATGKTRWHKVMAGKGFNAALLGSAYAFNPAVSGSRVCFLGSAGRVYCLDAKTGDLLWESHIGPGHEMAWKEVNDWSQSADPFSAPYRETLKKTGPDKPSNFRFVEGKRFTVNQPVATDKFLIVGDGIGGLTALSLETGKPVWQEAKAMTDNRAALTLWKQGDRYFVLHMGGNGVQCRDASTGKAVWEVSAKLTSQRYGPLVSGDTMVLFEAGSKTDGKAVPPVASGWRITPAGAEKRWTTASAGIAIHGKFIENHSPVIHHGHLYLSTYEGLAVTSYLCIDMADGSIKARFVRATRGIAAMVAGDGMIFQDWDIIKADPTDFRPLCLTWGSGDSRQPVVPVVADDRKMLVRSDFPVLRTRAYPFGPCSVYANGFYYYRGVDGIYCVDFRKQ